MELENKYDRIKEVVLDSLSITGLCVIVGYVIYRFMNLDIIVPIISILIGLFISFLFLLVQDDFGEKFTRFSFLRSFISIFFIIYLFYVPSPESVLINRGETTIINELVFLSPFALYLLIAWTFSFVLEFFEDKFNGRFNNEKYVTNIYSKTKDTNEILLVNRHVISEIIENMGRESDFPYIVHKKLIKEMRNLKYNIKYILMLEDEQVQSQVSTAASALLKVDYLAYLNFLKLVKKYDYSDYEIFTVSELQILVDRTKAMNSDLTNLIEAVQVKVEKDLRNKRNEFKENAKLEVSNTFKMLG